MDWTREEMRAFDADAQDIVEGREPTRCAALGLVVERAHDRPNTDGKTVMLCQLPSGYVFARRAFVQADTVSRGS